MIVHSYPQFVRSPSTVDTTFYFKGKPFAIESALFCHRIGTVVPFKTQSIAIQGAILLTK